MTGQVRPWVGGGRACLLRCAPRSQIDRIEWAAPHTVEAARRNEVSGRAGGIPKRHRRARVGICRSSNSKAAAIHRASPNPTPTKQGRGGPGAAARRPISGPRRRPPIESVGVVLRTNRPFDPRLGHESGHMIMRRRRSVAGRACGREGAAAFSLSSREEDGA